MRIILDVTCTVGERAGISTYAAELARALPAAAPDLEFVLFASRRPGRGRDPVRVEARNVRSITRPIPMRLLEAGWRRLGAPAVERLAGDADIVHVPHPRFPPRRRARLVVTVMDLAAWNEPSHGGPVPPMDELRRGLASAAAVIAPSEATAAAIRQAGLCDPARLHVTPLAVDAARFRPPPGGEARPGAAAAGPRPGAYALFVGTLQPRKNAGRLVEAFGRARRDLPEGARLVLAGPAGWSNEGVRRAAAAPDLAGAVTFLPYVPPGDLPALYADARLFCLPSLDEGFGLPVLEAMACGTPVCCSSAGSLPEVAGEAAVLFDPLSVDGIAEALKRAWLDEPLRGRLRAAGLERAARFSWSETARRTADVYRGIA